jgi:hypothetical protein
MHGHTPNIQQWLLPRQIRCALGNLARASLSVMQAGEPLASDGPIMIATARIGIMRIVIAKATSTFIVSSIKGGLMPGHRYDTSPYMRGKRSPVLPVNTL